MSKSEKKQGQKTNSPKGQFFQALLPFTKVVGKAPIPKVVSKVLDILEKPETKMPSGKNAKTEKFILGLSISFCLFKDNKKDLLEKGGPLKQYIDDHMVPAKQAPLVIQKFNELITRNTKKKS